MEFYVKNDGDMHNMIKHPYDVINNPIGPKFSKNA